MYNVLLRIVVFTDNSEFVDWLSEVPARPRFTHNIVRHREFLPSALACAHVAIVDVSTPLSSGDMRMRMRPGAKLVVCLKKNEIERLEPRDLSALDDIWRTPLIKKQMQLRFTQILMAVALEAELKQTQSWLNTLVDSMPDLVWFKDLDGIHHKVNKKFCEFVGKSREIVEGSTHSQIWDVPEDSEFACKQSENTAIAIGGTYLTDEIVKSGDGMHLLKTYKTALKSPEGEILGTVGFAHDMTNLLNLDMELKHFVESMPFPLAVCDAKGEVSQVNSNFLNFFGLQREKIIGRSYDAWAETMFKKEVSPVTDEEMLCFPRMEQEYFVTPTTRDINDIFGHKVGKIRVFRDVTTERELELRIWKAANTDALTGLSNRNALENYMKKLDADTAVNFFYIDLDGFKAVNDKWGHKIGDDAIRVAGRVMKEVFQGGFTARLGGDEFLACMEGEMALHDVEGLASRFLLKMKENFGDSEYLGGMSASIGIRYNGRAKDGMGDLIKQADEAMYKAKKLGKSRHALWDAPA